MSKKRKLGLAYLPTAGVRTDFKRFMNKFLSNNTVRYEHFSEVWRERNMSYLCAGRGTDREAREFIERVVMIAHEYFLPPYQFQVRVGGLYMLYAIYQIQPLIPKVKLRMTPTQWRETMFFQQQAAQQNHLDVVYVFQRLLQEQAFLFCYTPSEMSIYSTIKDVEDREENLADNLKEEKTAVANLFNYESLEKLSYVQDQYQQMKIGLAGQNATKPDKSLDVVQGELAEDIVVLLQTFKEKVSTFSKQGQRAEAKTPEKEHVPETTGERRHLLKTQAYNQLTVHPDKRHNLVVLNTSTSPKKAPASSAAGTATNAPAGVVQPVTKGKKQKSALNVSDSSSTGDSDDDYIPPKRLNSGSQRQVRQGDKLKSPEKRAAARGQAKATKQVTASSLNGKGLEKSHSSMPFITLEDSARVGGNQATKQSAASVGRNVQATNQSAASVGRNVQPTNQSAASVGRNVQPTKLHQDKEQNSTTVPVRKRGRPRKYSTSDEMLEFLPGLKNQLLQINKENPSQFNKTSVSIDRSNDMSSTILLNEDHNSVKNKVAFKWKSSGKADQFAVAKSPPKKVNVLEKVEPGKVSTRKRGRPRLVYDPTQPVEEVIVYPKRPTPQPAPTATYEVLYFPSGMKLSADLKGAKKFSSDAESTKVFEGAQKITSLTNEQKKCPAESKKAAPTINRIISTSSSRITSSSNPSPTPETVAEGIATNAVKNPPMTQSSSPHKPVNNNKPSQHTPASGNIQNNNMAQPAKLRSTTVPADNPIERLKQRCKRKLEEAQRRESASQVVKKCATDGQHAPTSHASEKLKSSGSVGSDQQRPAGICTTVRSKTTSPSAMKPKQSSTAAPITPTKRRGRPRSNEGKSSVNASFEFRFI